MSGANGSRLREWLAGAHARETPKLGTSPNGGNRDWLRERGIGEGEWLIAFKMQFEPGMTPGWFLTHRVWCCLLLQSAGYRSELCVRLVNQKYVAFTSNDLRHALNKAADDAVAVAGLTLNDEEKKALHVSKQHIRRALAKLEDLGAAFRTLQDGTPLRDLPGQRKGLQERQILLFCPFRPFPPEPGSVATGWLPKFAFSSPFAEICRSLRLLKLRFDPEAVANDGYLTGELAVAVSEYKRAESVAKKAAQERFSVAAAGRHIERKEDRKEIGERKGAPEPAPQAKTTPEPKTYWPGLLFAATTAVMDVPEGEPLKDVRTEFARLSEDEQKAAVEGIRLRIDNGQYEDPTFVPALARYIKERLWKRPLRSRKKKASTAALAYLDKIINKGPGNGD